MRSIPLSPERIALLDLVTKCPGLSCRELGSRLGPSHSAMSKLVILMCQKKMLFLGGSHGHPTYFNSLDLALANTVDPAELRKAAVKRKIERDRMRTRERQMARLGGSGLSAHQDAMDEIVHLAATRPDGFSTDIHLSARGPRDGEYAPKRVVYLLAELRRLGKIFSAKSGHKRMRFFTSQEAADAYLASGAEDLRKRAPKFTISELSNKKRPRVAPSGPAVILPTTKITIAPTHPPRFAPEPGFHRAITSDWMERRAGAQTVSPPAQQHKPLEWS